MKKNTLTEQREIVTADLLNDYNANKIQLIDALNVAFERGATIQKTLIPIPRTRKRFPSKEEREEQNRIWELNDKRAEIKNLAIDLLKSPIWKQESEDVLSNIKKSIITARQFHDLIIELIN